MAAQTVEVPSVNEIEFGHLARLMEEVETRQLRAHVKVSKLFYPGLREAFQVRRRFVGVSFPPPPSPTVDAEGGGYFPICTPDST